MLRWLSPSSGCEPSRRARTARAHALAWWVWMLAIGSLADGCGHQHSYVLRADVKPAPVDVEVRGLPGARGFWLPDAEYGGKVYVLVAGQHAPDRRAPTLVLVHGLGDAGVRDFYPLLPELARERRVVTFDLPGFGRSDKANRKYAPDGYARVVSEIIQAFAEGPADVLGPSMGGAIALLHAATYPAEVRRLIVVDAAGILHREAWVAQNLRRLTASAGRVSPRVAEMMAGAASVILDASRVFGAAPDAILEVGFLRQKILRAEPGRIAALSLMMYDFGPSLARIQAPTLIAWGDRDIVAPLRTGQLLADRLRDARLVVIPGAGHVVMEDAPAALLVEIERHLTSLPPSVMPPVRPGGPAVPAPGAAMCSGTADMQFRGAYDSLTIEGCTGARLDQVRARRLVIRRSTVSIVGSTFTEGVSLDASTLLMTGGGIDGPVAIDANDSQLDLAGVAIETSGQACHMTGNSRVVFSVCPVRSPKGLTYRHGFESSAPDRPSPAL
jgi:pimeloyl-ACP methyl ester carboxylesterase